MLANMGYKVGRIRVVPDVCGVGSSIALVQFSSGAEAEAAINALDGQLPADIGANLSAPAVSETNSEIAIATEIWQGITTPGVHVSYKGPGNPPGDHLWISGLNPWADENAVWRLFAGLRMTCKWTKIFPDKSGWGCNAIAELASVEEATLAIDALSHPAAAAAAMAAMAASIWGW